MTRSILLCLLLTGCAGVHTAAESTDTFAVCKGMDLLTTTVALNSGKFVEANPLLKPFIGPHNFFPLIAFSVAAYWLIQYLDEPKLTVPANAITCGVAARNMFFLL